MNSALAEPCASALEGLIGDQEPRFRVVPEYVSSAGREAIELAAHAGLILDPWQQLVLVEGLGERPDGKWSAFEVAAIVARQNGKGGIFEARALAGLYLFKEELQIYTAHEFKTAQEMFRRVLALIQSTPDLDRRVMRVRTSHGEEGIELRSGQRLRFLARSGGSGRGFSGDVVFLDEAMILGEDHMGALLPTMSARPNPQLWYGASAGLGAPSVQLARIRRRALKAIKAGTTAGGLAFFEWSVEPHAPECPEDCDQHDDPDDPRAWAKANPGLGIRISVEHVAHERATLGHEVFLRERLSVGDYPSEEDGWEVISQEQWAALVDPASEPEDPVAFAADVTPERSAAAIAVSGRTKDGLRHVEIIDHRPGVGWAVDRLADLVERWGPCAVVIDAAGPAGSLIAPLEQRGIEVVTPSAREMAQACGQFYTAVTEQQLRHLDQAPLTAALAGARKRPLGDAWAWSRLGASVDITPLVAATLAAWGHETRAHEVDAYDPLDNIW